MNARWSLVRIAVLLTLVPVHLPSTAHSGAKVFEGDNYSLELGLRMQPRMELEWLPKVGGHEWQRDFLVRRARWKATGKIQGVAYNMEWKIDGTDRIGTSPSASVENAYLEYPLGAGVGLRAGLYDQPFSRDRLTSDSKQLAVDRGAVSNVPDALGLADNAVGFHVLGKAKGGRAEYAIGLFDNRMIAGSFQDVPMVVGRLDLNFGSTQDVLRDCHFGGDSWYSVGVNGSYQGSIQNAAGARDGSNAAAGLDGMIDVPLGPRRLFMTSEFNLTQVDAPGATPTVETKVWMVGAGFLILEQRLQPIARFDQVLLDDAQGGGTRNTTYLGANLYQKGHNLKLQGDVRFGGTGLDGLDGMRLQGQLDF